MSEPTMLASVLATGTQSRDELAAIVREAETNAAKVMPPLAAEWMARELHELYVDVMYGAFMWWKRLEAWAPRVDEINAYGTRAKKHTEHEVFLAGSSPEDAAFTRPAETLGDALAADKWLVGAGAAHRLVIQMHEPWVIDRPATATAKESAA
jgi:hypothetical protein